jgi:hypothetical protein
LDSPASGFGEGLRKHTREGGEFNGNLRISLSSLPGGL